MTLNFDQSEINKFSAIAERWWDPHGEMRALHQLNPLRLHYINQHAELRGKKVLDVGCGGGILAEGLAERGADVLGIDMSAEALAAANHHQAQKPTKVDYRLSTAEELALTHAAQFDVITCLEMLEHVPDPLSIMHAIAKLAKPQAKIFFSTLNRNLKSYLFAIVGAEYLLKMLPKGTHDYAKFIRPSELTAWARSAGLIIQDIRGVSYSPLTRHFRLSADPAVNYLAYATKT